MTDSLVWFVTGSSTGFGRATVEAALAQNHKVAATLRNPAVLDDLKAKYSPDQLLLVKLDVTKVDQVEEAFAKTKEAFGRVDVVMNNAGRTILAEVEGTPDDAARELFDVLFWGASNVTKVSMKYFRENTPIGGRLLQMSSNIGISGTPTTGYYGAAKAALEALTESLQQEVDPAWNIKITLLEPGPFKTSLLDQTQGNMTLFTAHPAYTNPSLPTNFYRANLPLLQAMFDGDPAKAAGVFLKIAQLADPPARLPLHSYALKSLKDKASALNEAADKWAAWSDDVCLSKEAV